MNHFSANRKHMICDEHMKFHKLNILIYYQKDWTYLWYIYNIYIYIYIYICKEDLMLQEAGVISYNQFAWRLTNTRSSILNYLYFPRNITGVACYSSAMQGLHRIQRASLSIFSWGSSKWMDMHGFLWVANSMPSWPSSISPDARRVQSIVPASQAAVYPCAFNEIQSITKLG